MFKQTILTLITALSFNQAQAVQTSQGKNAMHENPLFIESTLPLQYPRFDLITNSDYAPAFERGMEQQLKEIDVIANNPEKPTFENTIIAMEKTGDIFIRTNAIFSNLNSANTNPVLQKLEVEISPKLAAHKDKILLNGKLFSRIKTLYNERETLGLDTEAKRVLWRYYEDFVRAGANLTAANKEKLMRLNEEIAALQTDFVQKTMNEVAASSVYVDKREDLAGLSDAEIEAMSVDAKADGHSGKYEIRLQNTTGQAVLAKLQNRALRQKILEASEHRGNRGGKYDTRANVVALAKKRAERAKLLGYSNFAAYSLADQTAGSVDVVNKMLGQLAPLAVAKARNEAVDMQSVIDAEKGGFKLTSADWDYYAEKVRLKNYDFDESQLMPYFELNHVMIDGVFFAANKLYGITFKERHDLPVYEPTVRVFEVFDKDGSQLAILITDMYARSNKKGGAWEVEYNIQNGLKGTKPVVAIHLNIPKPVTGQPTLLTYDEVRTAFHEFGHALHSMFSHVKYPRIAGTNVPRDFVEYPSQVNEMWAVWPEVLQNYARHYKTGAVIPKELLDKVEAASKFNQGYSTTELIGANIIDQAWHQIPAAKVPAAADVMSFDAAALKKAGVDFAPVPPRYRSTYFSHIFGGDFDGNYAAGYYSYFWSEVLDADSVEWFKAHGGLKRENGDYFRAQLLSRGATEDPLQLFRKFTGSDPDIGPLLKRRGL
ncbi:MAG TPA: M3 family metallopeptidase [Gammaproteobacteria bacterium]|nr:M3 family metallopeptidase [Gammaproteobacteria bacterium]